MDRRTIAAGAVVLLLMITSTQAQDKSAETSGGTLGGVKNIILNPTFKPIGWKLPVPWTFSKDAASVVPAPDKPDITCLKLESPKTKKGIYAIQKITLEPSRYVLIYDVYAAVGQEYRAYVEWRTKSKGYGSSGATWHKGTGNWEKKTIAFEYPIDMHGSYLALQMKAPGAAYFNNVSLIPEVKSSVVDTPQVDNVSSKTLIKNPGFELSQSSGSQSRSWVMASGVTVSKGVAAEGDYSLKLTTKNANFRTHAIQSGIATEPGQYYRLTYKVRAGEGSTQTTGYQQFMVFASWDPVVENGLPQTQIQQLSGRTFQDTFAAWQERTLEFFAPDTPQQAW